MSLPEKFAYWKGIPREEIDWHPYIDKNKCTGCGMCVTSCGREVFSYDKKGKKAVVANPLYCMVGCTSCKTWCIFDAILLTQFGIDHTTLQMEYNCCKDKEIIKNYSKALL